MSNNKSEIAVRNRNTAAGPAPKRLIAGSTDLATVNPVLAAEWHPKKNGELTASDVMPGSNQKVWWQCHRGHQWEASIFSRSAGRGCPTCNKERSTSFPEQAIYYYIRQIFPASINRHNIEKRLEVDIYLPEQKLGIEYDGSYYHQSERKQAIDARKTERLKELGIKLVRVAEEGTFVPQGTEHLVIYQRANTDAQLDRLIADVIDTVCQITGANSSITIDINRDKTAIWEQYVTQEKENSIANKMPHLLDEWNIAKNGVLRPEYISFKSNKRLWWNCKHCGYEWQATAFNRVRGTSCPACKGNIVVAGLNDLKTTHPDLAEEWDYERNGAISPASFSAGSGKKVWWKCQECGYSWYAAISNRTRSRGCPRCIGKVLSEEQSLAHLYPQIAIEWDSEKNGELTADSVFAHSDKKVWWRCHQGHSWQAAVSSRTGGNGCPYCGNKILLPGYNDLATTHPELMKEWDPDKNTLLPTEVFAGSSKRMHWKCSRGHSWITGAANRVRGNNCPYCAGKYPIQGENDLATVEPQLAAEWHPTKNGELLPQAVTKGSNRKVWWLCGKCGFEWPAIIWSRVKGRGCPQCAGRR